MATETEKEKELAEKTDEPQAQDAPPSDAKKEEEPKEEIREAAPIQLGTKRFVYAAYFGGAIGVAFLFAKFGNLIWQRVEAYRPQIGDPRDDIIMPIGAVVGALTALYYWRKQKTRQYAEEVAAELSQVTWPSRQEVTNSTTVVIIATAFATIFFALMDRFWAFVTDLVYRF
jgi:preprotein translocase subunit SecE